MKNKCQKESNQEYANGLLLPLFFLFGTVWHLATGHKKNQSKC